jgi:hypothetical protein
VAVPEYATLGSYDDRDDAIRAALDDLAPGATLTVHEQHCWLATDQICTCTPQTWTNPLD